MALTERAVLAGGRFWGMQDLIRRDPGWFQRVSAIPVATSLSPPIAIMEPTRRRSRSSLIPPPSVIGRFSNSSFRSTIRPHGTVKATMSGQLSIGDLLYQRPTEADCRRHDPRCRCFGAMAGQGRDRSRSRRRLLGGRARASGLPRTHIPDGYTCHFVRPDWKLPVREHSAPRQQA